MKGYNIKVYTLGGAFIKTLNQTLIMSDLSFNSQINGGQWELRIRLNLPFSNSSIQKTNIIRLFVYDDNYPTGKNIYTWVIGNITRVADSSGDTIEVIALGLSSILAYTLFEESGSYLLTKNQETAETIRNIVDSFARKYQSYPSDWLIWYYPFKWNANDESWNGLNGTVSGATLTTDRFWTANRAYQFNGTSNYINMWNVLNIFKSNFSFSAWFKTTTAGWFQSIVTKSRAAWANWRYWVMFTGWQLYSFIDFDTWTSIWVVQTPEAPYIDGNWHNVVVTIKRTGNLTLYVDNVNKGTVDISMHANTNHTSTDKFGIWAYNNSTWTAFTQWFFNWAIWTVSVYNKELSTQEIQKIYLGWLIYYTANSIENTWITSNLTFEYSESLNAIRDTAKVTNYFWTVDPEGLLQFHPKTWGIGTTTHYLTLGDNVELVEVLEDSERVVNKYILEYAGGATVVVEDLTSQATYGIREKKEQNTSILDAPTATATANTFINENKDEKRRTRIVVNSKYNLESIKPGDLVTVRNLDYDIEVLQIIKIDYNPEQATLEVDEYSSFSKEVFT